MEYDALHWTPAALDLLPAVLWEVGARMKLEPGDKVWITKWDGAEHSTKSALWAEWNGEVWLGCVRPTGPFRWDVNQLAFEMEDALLNELGDRQTDNVDHMIEQMLADGTLKL